MTILHAWATTQLTPLPFGLSELDRLVLRTAAFTIGVAVVTLAGWFLVEPTISRVVTARNRNNPTLEEAISRYVRLLVVLAALAVGTTAAGFTGFVGNSALVVAAGTLALGVAGQSVVGSLVSGLALVVDPQFNVGNYIRWDGGEGEVTSITLRVTRVKTPDGGLLTIPNTTLTDEPIVRPYHGDDCRIVEHIGISYEDDIGTALSLLRGVTDDVDGILDTPVSRVGVAELGGDAVVLRAEYWIDDPVRNQLPVRSAFARAVRERLDAAGVEVSPATKRELDGTIEIDTPA